MRLLITGAGRGGTCWLAEIIRASKAYDYQGFPVEDRQLFEHNELCNFYATKLASDSPNFTYENTNKLIIKYSDLFILFSVRHPVRHAMAKVANKDTEISQKAATKAHISVFAYLDAIEQTYKLYTQLKNKYPDKVFYTKLENRIIDTEKEIKNICKILNIKFKSEMLSAHKNTKNGYHQKRYGNKIDKSQAEIYSNWETVYNGFFKNKKDIIDIIKNNMIIIEMIKYFNYDNS